MKQQTNARQVTSLLFIVLTGWSLTMSADDGRDGWIALALAAVLSLPLAALCALPAERGKMNWFDLPAAAFGRGFGAGYLLALCALAFWSLCMAVLNGVIFVRTVSGGQWPVWLVTAAVLLSAGCAARGGILALWAEPVVWVVAAALLVSLLLSLQQLDWGELRPVLADGWSGMPQRVCLLLSAPFGEVFYAAAVLGDGSRQVRTGLLRGCVLAGVLLCLLYLRNVCMLGQEGAAFVRYPSYTAASLLSFGESFQRGEVLISGSLIICTAARAALLLNFLADGVRRVTGRGSHTRMVWCAAAVCGVVCVLCAGSSRGFANAQQLYQILLLPVVLGAAAVLLLGVCLHRKKT